LSLSALAALIEMLAEGAAGPATIFAAHLAATAALAVGAIRESPLHEMAEHAADERPFLLGIAIPMTAAPLDRPAIPLVTENGGEIVITGDFICLPAPDVCWKILVAAGEKGAKALIVDSDKFSSDFKAVYAGSGLEEFSAASLQLNNFAVSMNCADHNVTGQLWRMLRVLLAAAHLGNARAAAHSAWEYAKERIQTGRRIIEHQEVRRMIESMAEQVDAMTGMLRLAAGASEGDYANALARRAYTFCGTAGEQVCLDAIQTLGGYGYMKDYGVEKRARDAKSLQCLLGTYPEDILGGIE